LKSSLLALLTSAACLTTPLVLAQEPPTESQPPSPDLSEPAQSPEASQDIDQGAPSEDSTAATPASPPSSSTAALDDKKIEQFADAFMQVQTIQQKAASDLQTAQDPASADKVKTAAESEMIAAVERSGLKVEEFNQIVESMASNVEVRNRVAAKIQERSGG
jgi:Domain of unknown function (DUF4168)